MRGGNASGHPVPGRASHRATAAGLTRQVAWRPAEDERSANGRRESNGGNRMGGATVQ